MNKKLSALGLVIALTVPGMGFSATISGTGNPGDAVTGGVVEGFDTTAAGTYSSLTFGNLKITGVDADFTVGSDYNGSYNTSGGQSVFNDFDFLPSFFRFDFATSVSAFAFNWGASDFSWTLAAYDIGGTILDSFVIDPTFSSNLGEYYGISASGISYATLSSSSGDYVFIDNFASTSVDTVAPVPIPAGLPLLLGSIGVLALLRRRAAQK